MFNKTCTICDHTFYVRKIEDFKENFHKAKLGKYGFTARCKACRKKEETEPYKEIRKAKDQARYKPKRTVEIKCPICNDMFIRRDKFQKICSKKECQKLIKKIRYKKYKPIAAEHRKKRSKKALAAAPNSKAKKTYTQEELDYIKNNIRFDSIEDMAAKLKRTPRALKAKIKKDNIKPDMSRFKTPTLILGSCNLAS
ncbi:hypothetical protein [Poseidonibacter lekithochrous]|uniref:hypothetical protein n=1 Tax=Poseidonibacter lekithochrous TaxID=1904463 RepID=UPI000D380056|nr:hypothetical protein [Poseidonibacter lekithochrous]